METFFHIFTHSDVINAHKSTNFPGFSFWIYTWNKDAVPENLSPEKFASIRLPGELARRLWLLRLPDKRAATVPELFHDTIQIATQGPRYDILVLLCGTRIVPFACGWTRREAREAGMVCFFLVPNTNRLKVTKIRRLDLRQWFPKFSF